MVELLPMLQLARVQAWLTCENLLGIGNLIPRPFYTHMHVIHVYYRIN